MTEYMPEIAKWKLPFLNIRGQIIARTTNQFNYFLIRHDFSLEERKRCDLYFITHYQNSHPDDHNASIIERLRYRYYWRLYGSEIHEAISAVKEKEFDDVSAEVEEYVKKWQAFSQPPAFVVEMIHGMDGRRLGEYSIAEDANEL